MELISKNGEDPSKDFKEAKENGEIVVHTLNLPYINAVGEPRAGYFSFIVEKANSAYFISEMRKIVPIELEKTTQNYDKQNFETPTRAKVRKEIEEKITAIKVLLKFVPKVTTYVPECKYNYDANTAAKSFEYVTQIRPSWRGKLAADKIRVEECEKEMQAKQKQQAISNEGAYAYAIALGKALNKTN